MSPVHAFLEPLEGPGHPANLASRQNSATLEERRKAAYSEGYKQGMAEGMRRRALETGDAMTQLQSDINTLAADFTAVTTRANIELLELLRNVLGKTLPTLCERGFAEEVLPIIERTLEDLPSMDLSITVPADLVEPLREDLTLETQRATLSISETAEAGAASRVEIVWSEGCSTVDLDRIGQEIIDALDSHITSTKSQMNRNDHDRE